jgi:hypothetical protein
MPTSTRSAVWRASGAGHGVTGPPVHTVSAGLVPTSGGGHINPPVASYSPPSPQSFLQGYQYYAVTGVKIPNNPFGIYSSFIVTASSPSRGAYAILSYSTHNQGSYTLYSYSIYSHNPFGSWGATVTTAAAYTTPYAPNMYALDPVH